MVLTALFVVIFGITLVAIAYLLAYFLLLSTGTLIAVIMGEVFKFEVPEINNDLLGCTFGVGLFIAEFPGNYYLVKFMQSKGWL